MLAGVPPFSNFIGKFAMISGVVSGASGSSETVPAIGWIFIAVLLTSGLAVLIALLRFGIARFWVAPGDRIPVLALESAPVIILLVVLIYLTVQGSQAMRYTQRAAADLLAPPAYADSVLTSTPTADPAKTEAAAEREAEGSDGEAP